MCCNGIIKKEPKDGKPVPQALLGYKNRGDGDEEYHQEEIEVTKCSLEMYEKKLSDMLRLRG